ncbi:MAG: DUF2325 domain-containing protein [Clostridiales bacterium]|nr:DUF2325 domain-containing protein [Clostridiales bacterium]
MSVVIVGGNECMTRQYRDLCAEYRCSAKIYPKMKSGLKDFGNPDLLILFTDTVSHKMVYSVMSQLKIGTTVCRSHSSSMSALRKVLEEQTAGLSGSV